jgi:hypothetical protein
MDTIKDQAILFLESMPRLASRKQQRYGLEKLPYLDYCHISLKRAERYHLTLREPLRLSCTCRKKISALGRTRTCDLLIRSHSLKETEDDTEGQGKTKLHFYRRSSAFEVTGRDKERHPVAV